MKSSPLSLHILGTGRGASHVYDGDCSTAMVLCRAGEPVLLVDLGLGVTRACRECFGGIPAQVLVTHNHSDHAGELPVVLLVEAAAGRRLTVFAECEVARRLQAHRLAEHHEQYDPATLADWRTAEPGQRLSLAPDIEIEFVRARHTEHCCGFLLYRDGQVLLGYSGDSAVDRALYTRLAAARTRLYDARADTSRGHATFAELADWLDVGGWIVGHGLSRSSAPSQWPLLFAGDTLSLDPPAEGVSSP